MTDHIVEINLIECPICFLESEKMTNLPCCNYIMCEDCLVEWKKRSPRCPSCNTVNSRPRNENQDNLGPCTPVTLVCPLIIIVLAWLTYAKIIN
ncbi:MAG: hypothetical protein CMO44_17685 [Verrucomicrobiales bacterium]|nr:hypothetical protein [Verrucomicrobiales bacterium]